MPQVIYLPELARRLGCKRLTVARWIERGSIPLGRKLGNQMFWCRRELGQALGLDLTVEIEQHGRRYSVRKPQQSTEAA